MPRAQVNEAPLLAGRYRIEGELGQGGIAKVVRALDTHTGQQVALKLMFPNLRSQPDLVARFHHEVTVVGKVNHPHVVPIWRVYEDEKHLFLVMPLLAGDLAAHLADAGPMPLSTWLRLALDLCAGLQAAHEAGIVHRDLKPQNVLQLVATEDEVPRFAICDFGLARTLDTAGLTMANTLLGTPAYMAPEVAREGFADPRSDVYSLSVVLYEALTGRPPFVGNTPFALLHQHLTAPPPSPTSFRPDVPETLAKALLQGLAKDPSERPGSAGALGAALDVAIQPNASTSFVPPASPRLVPSQHAKCPSCGQVFVRALGVCTTCGHEGLPATVAAGPYVVAVDGQFAKLTSHALDTDAHARWLGALEKVVVDESLLRRLRKDSIRAPLVLAWGVDKASAELLADTGREAGLIVHVMPRWRAILRALGTPQAKISAITTTVIASLLASKLAGAFHAEVLLLALPAALVGSNQWRKLSLKRNRGKGEPARDLALLSGRLRRTNERRLVGRIAELAFMMGDATEGGKDECQAMVLLRVQPAIDALVRLDEADEACHEASLDAEEAQRQLRETERLRLLTINDLLHVLGRLEALAARSAMARDAARPERTEAWRDQLDELNRQSEAMNEGICCGSLPRRWRGSARAGAPAHSERLGRLWTKLSAA